MYDNLELPPPPDASWLLSGVEDVTATPVGRKGRASNRDINLQEDYDNSQFLQGSNANDDAIATLDDLDLGLDFGLDDPSIEVGRNAPMGGIDDDVFSDIDMVTGKNAPDVSRTLNFDDNVRIADDDGDVNMGGEDDFQFNDQDRSLMPGAPVPVQRAGSVESQLSDVDELLASKDVADMYEPLDDTTMTVTRRPTQRARKQKVLMPDDEIALTSTYIKQQQANRNNITKPASFLPRDPLMLALMDMQKNGGFVSSIMSDGRSAAWAPELRGMLSLDTFRGELKRKRDSGVADVGSDVGAAKSPRLEIGDETDFGFGDALGNQSVGPDGTMLEIPADDGMFDDGGSPLPSFDETTMPLVHPADSGPVSQGTKHAVHVLRDLFGHDCATDEEKRKKSNVVFQSLLPEETTTKADATKMFFECLVLATKDAIKVDQGEGLGDAIRVRGKRGLWGDWAERDAGGKIDNQDDVESTPVGSRVVAVGA